MLEENQKDIKNSGRKEKRNSMNNILELLYLLKELDGLHKCFLKKNNMQEHTFIVTQDKEILKTNKIDLPNNVSDEAIKGVMIWQKKGLKQN